MGDRVAIECLGKSGHYVNNVKLENKRLSSKKDDFSELEWEDKTPDNINFDSYKYKSKGSTNVANMVEKGKNGYELKLDKAHNNTGVVFPIYYHYTTVNMQTGDNNLKLAIHPKENANADKGSVLYTDKDGNVQQTDSNHELNVKNVELHNSYIFSGIVANPPAVTVTYEDGREDKSQFEVSFGNSTNDSADKPTDDEVEKYIRPYIDAGRTKVNKDGTYYYDDLTMLDSSKEYEFEVTGFVGDTSQVSGVIKVKNSRIVQGVNFNVDKELKVTAKSFENSDYIFRWKDGTFSNADGSRTADQTTLAKSYGINPYISYAGSSYGHLLNYYDSVAYYSLTRKDESQYESMGKFSGNVYYNKRVIFTNKTDKKPIAGCAVYVGDDYLVTDNDGHFEHSYDKGYNVYDTFTLIISNSGKNYRYDIAPDQEGNYIIDAEQDISYSNPILMKGSDKIDYNSILFDNGDATYTISLGVESNNASIVPSKTYFVAYKDGIPVGSNAVDCSDGFATFSFNPTKYAGDGETATKQLDAGTTFSVYTVDTSGCTYTEMETGLSLEKHIEERGVKANINPSGGSVDLLGSYTAGIGSDAKKKSDDGKYNTINLTDDDIEFMENNLMGNGSNVKLSAEGATETITANALKGSDYLTLNIGFSFSGDGSSNPNAPKVSEEKYSIPRAVSNAFTGSNLGKEMNELSEDLKYYKDLKEGRETDAFVNKANFTFNVAANARLAWVKTPNRGYKLSDVVLTQSARVDLSFNMRYQTPVLIQLLGDISLGVHLDATEIGIWKMNDANNQTDTGVLDLGDLIEKSKSFSEGGGKYWYTNIDFKVPFKPYVGVGFAGLSAKIGGDGAYELKNIAYTDVDKNINEYEISTNKVTFTAKVKLKALIIETSFAFANAEYDFNKKKKGVTLSEFDMGNTENLLKSADSVFKSEYLSYLDDREGWEASSAVRLSEDNGIDSDEITLIDKVYEAAKPLIENIGDGKFVLAYCDRLEGSTDKTGIYYSIYDGSWSAPKLISNSSNYATEPYLLKADSGTFLSWTEVSKTEDASSAQKLNSSDIRLAVFDTGSMSFGEPKEVTYTTDTDKYSDRNPVLSTAVKDGKDVVMVYYLKSYYEENNTLVGDIVNPYTLTACRIYDVSSGEFINSYSDAELSSISENSSDEAAAKPLPIGGMDKDLLI